MKVIDLLVDKVNGKQLPNKIKANGIVFILDKDNNEYKREDGNAEEFYTDYMIDGFVDLTDEVEILEEEKKIPEKISIKKEHYNEYIEDYCFKNIPLENLILNQNEVVIIDKIDEIIDYLDYLKSKGDE